MKHPLLGLALIALLVAVSLACNVSMFGSAVPTATPLRPPATLLSATEPPAATVALPPAMPSDTPVPVTSTPAPTATSSVVMVAAGVAEQACRFGPASEFSSEGVLPVGRTVPVLARNATSLWVRIEHLVHPGWNCWLKVADVVVSGDLTTVPVEPAPSAFVEAVDVDMTPSEATVPGCVFPYTFSVQFWITVNGPATVKFQRSLDNGNKAPVETQTFLASGRYAFTDHNRVGSAGEHWFQVDVFSPNATSGRWTAKAVCGP